MRFGRFMLLCLLCFVALASAVGFAAAPGTATGPTPRQLVEMNGDLYEKDGSPAGLALIARNVVRAGGVPHDTVRFPAERRICFAYLKSTDSGKSIVVLECSAQSVLQRQWEVLDEALRNVTGIQRVSWMQEQKILLECRTDGRQGLGIELGLFSGEHRSFAGRNFAWDRFGTTIAYFRDPAGEGATAELHVDERRICDVPAPRRRTLQFANDGKTLVAWFAKVDVPDDPGRILTIDLRDEKNPRLDWQDAKPRKRPKGRTGR